MLFIVSSVINLYDFTQYAWIIFILLAAEFIAAILVVRFRNDIQQIAIDGIRKGIDNYDEGNEYNPIDDMQKELQCCGIKDFHDWDVKFNNSEGTTHTYPNSCCRDAVIGTQCLEKSGGFFTEPCLTKFEETFRYIAKALAGVGVTVAVIQLTAVISSCCLARAFRREYEVV